MVVTGGLGFFGSNAVHRLVDEAASGVVLDALVPDHGGDLGNLDDLPTGTLIDVYVGDIGDIGDELVVDAVAHADVMVDIRRRT